jgi:hypothetical protein
MAGPYVTYCNGCSYRGRYPDESTGKLRAQDHSKRLKHRVVLTKGKDLVAAYDKGKDVTASVSQVESTLEAEEVGDRARQ